MIKLQQLAHALALGRHGNFHRAAAAQHLSQPALSRSIQSLEEGLGVPLFDRQSAAVTPTLYGEALLRRAAVIIEEAEELEREIRLLQGIETGTFTVAMGAYASELSWPPGRGGTHAAASESGLQGASWQLAGGGGSGPGALR